MEQNWLNEKLCSFDEKVRVELGPQIIELECNDENLADTVTHAIYRDGGIDAYGKVIRPDRAAKGMPGDAKRIADFSKTFGVVNEGEIMHCVDWRAKHVPHVWKIYQWQETEDLDKEGKPVSRFVQVGENEDKAAALAEAAALAGGMN